MRSLRILRLFWKRKLPRLLQLTMVLLVLLTFASDTGVATLKLSGSCSGCAMSKITLQRGVENTLKHYVPEVTSIVGQDDEEAEGQGYEPYFPKDKEPDWEKLLRKD